MNRLKLNPVNIYLIFIIVSGIILSTSLLVTIIEFKISWDIFVIFTISIILLTNYLIVLPPKGNSLSMDSAIYLGCLFLFGMATALELLIISSLFIAFLTRKIVWWKHLFNFSNYAWMLFGASITFNLLDGTLGYISINNILIYMVSLSVYYMVNVIVIGTYFYIASNPEIFRSVLRESLFSYMITLVLSLILAFLLMINLYMGIVLFSTLSLLLSFAFRQYFHLYQQVTEKANTDQLTGLYNHGYFKELLEEKVRESMEKETQLSLAIIDLDDFKKYNDTYGHIQGDNLLKNVGKFIVNDSRTNDIVARYGGEEFVILMPNTTEKEAFKRLNRLRKKMNDTCFEGVEVLPYGCLSFSGGVIEYEEGTSQDFLHKADEAMYLAKSKGKNQIIQPKSDSVKDNDNSIELKEKINILQQQVNIFLKKDLMTFRHSQQVFEYTKEFCKWLDLTNHEEDQLIMGALIHDIGKVEIPRELLTKTGKLTGDEWEMMKKHVIWGKEWVESLRDFEDLIPLVELHHERFDGKGYPHGLQGRTIPKLARILCVIDSFDAMTTERPYQSTRSFEEAIEELKQCSGTQFDPEYVEPFIDMIHEMYLTKQKAQ